MDQVHKMRALRAFTHEGVELDVGDTFYASPVDAGYYARHRRAEPVIEAASAPPVAVQPPPAPAAPSPAAPEPVVDVTAAASAPAPTPTPRRRSGRASNAG